MKNRRVKPSATPTFSRAKWKWPLFAAAPLALAAGWIAYSSLFINRRQKLPPALPGGMFRLGTPAGGLNVYFDGPEEGAPLVLVHSINAAASAYEVRPIYLHYRKTRPVYAVELPGFGLSQRENRIYTSSMMVTAIRDVVAEVRARHNNQPVNLIAVSLACEYAARAAIESSTDYQTLGFVSPTGFDKVLSGSGGDRENRGSRLAHWIVSQSFWRRAFWRRAAYDLLVSRLSMRLFLQKTWGSASIDEGLFAYSQLTAHQAGAEYVVWSFLTGFLFPDDASRVYRQLLLPVWVVHGTRGDFVDYTHASDVAQKPNWIFRTFESGAFPHFERLEDFVRSYDLFQRSAATLAQRN